MNNTKRQQRRIIVAGFVLIVAGCITAYLPATQCGYIWDDYSYVQGNQTLRSVEGLGRIWFKLGAVPDYYPLTFTTFWLEYHVWKLAPFGYHLNNILLHVLNALLLWWLLRRFGMPGAWLAAAVFALHPVHVESVAWITERKNVLSLLFYLLSFHAFLSFDTSEQEVPDFRRRWRFYCLSLVLYILAMLSKTSTITLPAIMLVVVWWRRNRIGIRDVAALLPYFVVAVPLYLAAFWTQRNIVAAVGKEWDYTLLERVLIAGRVMWFYAGSLIWPSKLVFIYPKWDIDTALWWQYLFVAGAVAVPVSFWLLRKRLGRGLLAAVLFFGLTLVPASGFFNIYWHKYSFVADHVQYVASIGLIVLVVAAGCRIAGRYGRQIERPAKVFAACILVTLGALTWRQCHVYKDLETLWRDTIDKNPESWMAHNNLGNVFREQGKLDDAIASYRRALEVKDDHVGAYYNLGIALYAQDKLDDAISSFREALRLKPDYIDALNDLAYTLTKQGKFEDAVGHYRHALYLNSNNAKIHINLAYALLQQGKISEAIISFEETLRLDPNHIEALNNLAWVLAAGKDTKFHDAKEAIRLARRVCELTSYEDVGFLDTLAAAYAAAGRFEEAIETAQKAVKLADSTGKNELADQIKERLELYKRHQPYTEPSSGQHDAQ